MSSAPAKNESAKWIVGFLVAGSLLIVFRSTVEGEGRLGAAVACISTVACIASIVRTNPEKPISVGSMYATLFGVFHIGLLIPIALGYAPRMLNAIDRLWVASPAFSSAAFLVALAQSAVAVGYLLRYRRVEQIVEVSGPSADAGKSTAGVDGPAIVGMAMLLVGLVTWFKNVVLSDVSLSSSYARFLAATAKTNMPITYLLIGFGMGVVSSSARKSARKWSLMAFGIWALPAFLLGLRGEVIIPAAAYLVVAARRQRIRLRARMAVVVLGALAAGSAIRVARKVGFGNSTLTAADLDPLSGLTELGYSIRPLVVVIDLHDRLGQPYVGFATYLAPFRRFVVGRLLGGRVLSVAEDPSVFGGWILRHVGPIGGSPAAEAYRSGGILAMVGVMILIGAALASLDGSRDSLISNAFVGMVTFILLLWVRNDFTPVPAEFAVSMVVILLIWLLEHRTPRRHPANGSSLPLAP